jgi:lamin tail-like protein
MLRPATLALGLAIAAGCAKGGAPAHHGDGGTDDAPCGDCDGPPLPTDGDPHHDAPPPPPGGHLLLSEVVVAPTGGEFVEIVNPTTAAVDLTHYYLADNGNYYRVPSTSAVTVDSGDFVVKFPAGASIPARGVATIAIDTDANYTTAYGAAPTYSIGSHTMTTFVATGTPTLTNTGEPIVLFAWDGASDLVTDVDIMIVGAPTATNALADKSNAAVDGPDAGSTPSAYAADARTMPPQSATPAAGQSTKRVALEAGHETQGGAGNGVGGDDETSEDTAATWDTAFTAPTPGAVPTALVP